MQLRTIIILIPKKETNVHANITTLPVLFHRSFPIQLFNSIVLEYQSKQEATIRQFGRQIDNVKACSFFHFRSGVPFQLFQSHKCIQEIYIYILKNIYFNKLPMGNLFKYIFLSYSFVYFFIALP